MKKNCYHDIIFPGEERMDKLLFTELIIEGLNGNSAAYIEAYNRLKFCGFDEKTMEYIIVSEKEIIKKRKLNFETNLCKKFWWVNNLKKYENEHLFKLQHEEYYFTDFNSIKNSTLTLSELIAFYDEAYYICHFGNNVPNNVLRESIEIAKYEDNRSWIVNEFYSRIELLYRMANNIRATNKMITDIYKIHAFYDNEVHLIMTHKWRDLMNIPTTWEAYTDDYYQTI